jgi:hypothetical protein
VLQAETISSASSGCPTSFAGYRALLRPMAFQVKPEERAWKAAAGDAAGTPAFFVRHSGVLREALQRGSGQFSFRIGGSTG